MALSHSCNIWVGVWGNQVVETSPRARPFLCPNGGSPRGDTPPSHWVLSRAMSHGGERRAVGLRIQPRLGWAQWPHPTAAYLIEDRRKAPL